MQSYREVSIIRNKPRDRNRIEGLTGYLEISITACSRVKGDIFDSYLHIGTGTLKLQLELDITKISSLINRVDFRDAVNETARVMRLDAVDMVTINGKPTIPGSTIKGNIRSRLELSFRATDGKVRSCFTKSSPPFVAKGSNVWRHREIWGEVLLEDRGKPCDHTKGNPVCLICDIFGAPGLSSLVYFDDFIGYNVKLDELDAGYGLRIIVALPGSEFDGKIWFKNLKEEELGLILIGMGMSSSTKGRPLLLGRLKYRGSINTKVIGRIRYQVKSLALSYHSSEIKGLRRGEVKKGDELNKVVTQLVNHAKEKFKELSIVDEVKALVPDRST